MLQIERVVLSLEESEDCLPEKAAAILRLPPREIQSLTILRRAIDAREGVCLVYTLRVKVKNEEKILRRCRGRQVSRAEKEHYRLPPPVQPPAVPLVVVGAGPGGLFCALALFGVMDRPAP